MSFNDQAIVVEGLGKRYRLGTGGNYGRLTETLSDLPRRLIGKQREEPSEFWALRDVTFEVAPGEIVGVVGANGAGKSTLLKLLSRVTRPTEGQAHLHGRIGSLLEVGTGFHPELTGRENVFLSGAILGMRRSEIARRFTEIVDFAGIGQFLETPVKRYSSGMQVRLGFAVAAHLDTEILLVDEVLAVGDASFQQKSLDRMRTVSEQGRTVLFVSHNAAAVRRLCNSALLLTNGQLEAFDDAEKVVDRYMQSANSSTSWASLARNGDGESFRFVHASVRSDQGDPITAVSARQPFVVEIEYEILERIEGLVVGIIFTDGNGTTAFDSYDIDSATAATPTRHKGRYIARCRIPAGLLNSGSLDVSLIAVIPNFRRISHIRNALRFDVWESAVGGQEISMVRRGAVAPLLNWSIENL